MFRVHLRHRVGCAGARVDTVSAVHNGEERMDTMPLTRYRVALFAVTVGWACAGVTPATASVMTTCATAGITPALVTKIFGPGAVIRARGVPTSTPCSIYAGEKLTTVFIGPSVASQLAHTVNYLFYQLKGEGPAQKTPVSGAGPGAMLLTGTNYDRILYPTVLLKAGGYIAQIAPKAVGVGQSQVVYREWEALARAIHAHDG